jgi:hypothetical protein
LRAFLIVAFSDGVTLICPINSLFFSRVAELENVSHKFPVVAKQDGRIIYRDNKTIHRKLFLLLFTAGFLTARIAGITFWMEFTFLTISQLVALNPQNPVPSQTIIDAFLGMMFGMWIAAVLSRLLWPRL